LSLISCTIISHKFVIAWKTGTETPESKSKLDEVLSDKVLRVVLDYNTTDYFVYKGEPMGFQYELLKTFCDEKNIKLTILANNNLENSIQGLLNNKYDLVAKNIIPAYLKNDKVDFTLPIVLSNLVLVQRLPEKPIGLLLDEKKDELIKYRFQLKGRTVHVSKNSVFAPYLKLMSDELSGGITVVEDSLYSTEQLIAMVSRKEIDYTVCNESTGSAMKEYFQHIDFSTPLGLDQKFSWATSKRSPEWKVYLNEWITNFKETPRYSEIYERYFSGKSEKMFRNSEFNSFLGGKLSEFDDMVKEISAYYQWDWRLISSIIFQESNFNPLAQSMMGAKGLILTTSLNRVITLKVD
jgi:membrane-bound lytic murein transglycosylase F